MSAGHRQKLQGIVTQEDLDQNKNRLAEMDLYQLEEEARRIRQNIQKIKNTIDSTLDPDHMKLKDSSYNQASQVPSSEQFRYLKRMGEQLKQLQETIERREIENQFNGGARLPLLKHKRNFKDPATEPKKTFLKDDEELEEEIQQQNEEGEVEGDEEEVESVDFQRQPDQAFEDSSTDPSAIKSRLKVQFSAEKGLKAGRFHDPNALYLKMFEKKPNEANKPKEEVKSSAASNLPSIGGTLGVSGQQFRDILRIIQVQNEGGFVLEVMNEESEEVKQQIEKEVHSQALAETAMREKQNFMENLIQTVSPNMLFKTQDDTKLQETAQDGGMRNLKEKYDQLKTTAPQYGIQNIRRQWFQLPEIKQANNNFGTGSDKSNLAMQRFQVVTKEPKDFQEDQLVIHDHRLNGAAIDPQLQKINQVNQQEALKKVMNNIFYSDDAVKAQKDQSKMITSLSGKTGAKVFIDPKHIRDIHPVFSKLRPTSLETLFEGAGELIRLYPHNFLYKEGDHGYSGYIIISGKIDLFSNGLGTLGSFVGGDTLGEEGIIEGDKAVLRNQEGVPLRQETAQCKEESFVLELRKDNWQLMRDMLLKLQAQMDLFTLANILKSNFTKKKAGRLFKTKQKMAHANRQFNSLM